MIDITPSPQPELLNSVFANELPEARLDALLDAVIAGIKSGDRIERDPQRMAKLTGLDPEQLRSRFPDDDALYAELMTFVFGNFGSKLAGEGETVERSLAERYVAISTPSIDSDWGVPERKAEALMLLTLVNPAAHRVARETFARWQNWVNDSAASAEGGHVLRFIADGWWFTEAFGFGPVPVAQRARVRELVNAAAAPLYASRA